MSLFINYLAQPTRTSPLNLAVARVQVCLYAAWKVATYPFPHLADFPDVVFLSNALAPQNNFFQVGPAALRFIPWEQGLIVTCLLLVAIGWRTGLTAFVAALLLAHLSGLNYLIVNERTFLLTVYFLILYGLYRHEDLLTLDHWRSPRPNAPDARYPMTALRVFLLVFSLIYFFTGFAKWLGGGMSLAWAAPENVRMIVQNNALYHIHQLPPVAARVLSSDAFFTFVGLSTLALELGFVVAVLCRWPITLFILGLAAMHVGILATMQLNYLSDMAVFYALYLPWDALVARLRRGGIKWFRGWPARTGARAVASAPAP